MTFRPDADRWLSTAECARSIGVSDWWIRERSTPGSSLPPLSEPATERSSRCERWARRASGGRRTATAGPAAVERRATGGIRALRHCVERWVPSILRRAGSPSSTAQRPNPRVERKRADSTDGAHCQVPD